MTGLTLYTAAFIGEIVRAGIQAISYGQIEAASAVGLNRSQTLQLIILPQALRIIIPPLGNQYLNLTKNSSLATAIGFLDVFAITKTIIHQSGQDVVMIIAVMITYLASSLIISAGMNWLNGRMRLKER
jgi:general L-amino acid transport system permease protein